MAKAKRATKEVGGDAPKEGLSTVMGASAEPLKLERLIHSRMRLAIVSALAANDCVSFSELKAMLGATDGNLSVHARKLEEAGYIECTKYFRGRRPRTDYRLTRAGKGALDRYLEHMSALIRHTRGS